MRIVLSYTDAHFDYEVYIEDIEDTPGRSLEEASKEIEETLYTERVNQRFKVWVEGMRAKSHIKIIQ